MSLKTNNKRDSYSHSKNLKELRNPGLFTYHDSGRQHHESLPNPNQIHGILR
jgi:hypothetical protein